MTLTNGIVTFINNNHKALAENKSKIEDLIETHVDFIEDLLICDALTDAAYTSMLSSIKYRKTVVGIDMLSQSKVEKLIQTYILHINIENYKAIHLEHPSLVGKYIKQNWDSFLDKIEEMKVNNKEYETILEDKNIALAEKCQILSACQDTIKLDNIRTLTLILDVLLIKKITTPIDIKVIDAIITNKDLDSDKRLIAYWNNVDTLPEEYKNKLFIKKFASSLFLSTTNDTILHPRKRVKVPHTPNNNNFISLLLEHQLISSYRILKGEKFIQVNNKIHF